MYLKVIVLEIKEDYCLAMTEDGEVIRIRKKKGIRVGEKIYVLQEDIYEKQAEEKKEHVLPFTGKNSRASIVRRIAAVVAIFAICFSAVFYLQPSKTVYAKVSVDGMSSIQLTVDKDFKVVDAVSYDATVPEEELEKLVGKKLLDLRPFLLDLKGDGTDAVIVAYGFLESESSDDESALKESLKELFGTKSNLYLRGSAEDVKAAEREAESLGIYIAKKAVTNDQLDDLAEDMSVEELLKLLRSQPGLLKNREFMDELNDKYEDRTEPQKEDVKDMEDDDDEPEIEGKDEEDDEDEELDTDREEKNEEGENADRQTKRKIKAEGRNEAKKSEPERRGDEMEDFESEEDEEDDEKEQNPEQEDSETDEEQEDDES